MYSNNNGFELSPDMKELTINVNELQQKAFMLTLAKRDWAKGIRRIRLKEGSNHYSGQSQIVLNDLLSIFPDIRTIISDLPRYWRTNFLFGNALIDHEIVIHCRDLDYMLVSGNYCDPNVSFRFNGGAAKRYLDKHVRAMLYWQSFRYDESVTNVPAAIFSNKFELLSTLIEDSMVSAFEQIMLSDKVRFQLTTYQKLSDVAKKNNEVEIASFLVKRISEKFDLDSINNRNEDKAVRILLNPTGKEAVKQRWNFRKCKTGYVITSTAGGNKEETSLVLPSNIDGIPVVAIGAKAFYDAKCPTRRRNIDSIDVPDCITWFRKDSFSRIDVTNTIKLPDSLEIFDDDAIIGSKCRFTNLPADIRYIGDHAFYHEYPLLDTSVFIADADYIGNAAFLGNTNADSYDIKCRSVANGAFSSIVASRFFLDTPAVSRSCFNGSTISRLELKSEFLNSILMRAKIDTLIIHDCLQNLFPGCFSCASIGEVIIKTDSEHEFSRVANLLEIGGIEKEKIKQFNCLFA